jgi:arylsulfatase A-like enzyme
MTTRAPDLILVTVDCLRRDRLSAYGYERPTTPFLDGLLDGALHATSAHSVSSWTCPAVCSLLTGLYPHRHGGGLVPGEPKNLSRNNLPTVLPADIPMISDVLAARGYATAAIGAVWNAHLSIPGRFGYMAMVEKAASKLARRSVRWLRTQDRPAFLWLHLGDPHEPLDVPRSMWNLFGEVPRLRKVRTWDYTTSRSAVGSDGFLRYREARIRLYDVAVRAADAAIGELWKALGDLGRRDRTVMVVTADHGEEFWEHREEELQGFTDPRDIFGAGHGHNLFQVHLLVPLVMIGPGIPPGEISENVSLVDVVPTVLEATGVEAPSVDGRSLLGLLDRRPVLAEGIAYGYEKRAVVLGDEKLLSAPGDGYERTFRLGPDRREAVTVEDGAVADRLRRLLPGEPRVMGEQVEGTEEIVEHLRGLGYIE